MNDLKKKLLSFSKTNKIYLLVKKNWPILAIFFVSLIFFYPVFLQNKIPLPADALVGAHLPWIEVAWEGYPAGVPIKNQEITDAISQFYPWRSLVGEFWRVGKVPLWNSYMFSGTPFLATWHSASLYPLNIFYLFFSDINAWTLLIFAQVFLSALFMYLFLQKLKLSKEASFLGAVAFSFSGYMIAWLEFATGGHAALWFPLLLLLEINLIKSKKNIWLVPISVVFFFVYTAGDFQAPLYITITYILFGIWLVFSEKVKNWKIQLVKTFLGLFFGILLSLPQLLPTFELFANSVRLDDPYIKEYFFGLMHWEKIVNFIWPDFFGNVVTRNYWGKFGYHEYLVFAGATTLLFVTFSFFKKKLKYENFFWFVLVICLLFLFPTPLAFLPFKLRLPGLGTSSASRIIFLVDFCLATLAACGFTKWQKIKKGLPKIIFSYLVITCGVFLGLLISINLLIKDSASVTFPLLVNLKVALRNIIPSTMVLVMLLILLSVAKLRLFGKFKKVIPYLILIVAVAELLRFGWKNTAFSPKEFVFPETETIEFLINQKKPFRIASGIPLNYAMFYKLQMVEGYDPIYPRVNSEWYSVVNSGGLSALSGRYGLIHVFTSDLINYANIKYVVDYQKDSRGQITDNGKYLAGVEEPRFKEVFSEGRVKVFENTESLPRVWMSTNYEVVQEKDALIDKLDNDVNSDERLIILESNPRLTISDAEIKYLVSNYSERLNRSSFNVDVSDNALLFHSQTYYPGWKAYVDGEETEVFKANLAFQVIEVPKGKHKIGFKYEPISYKIGKGCFLATAFLLLTIVKYEYKNKKSNKNSQKSSA